MRETTLIRVYYQYETTNIGYEILKGSDFLKISFLGLWLVNGALRVYVYFFPFGAWLKMSLGYDHSYLWVIQDQHGYLAMLILNYYNVMPTFRKEILYIVLREIDFLLEEKDEGEEKQTKT